MNSTLTVGINRLDQNLQRIVHTQTNFASVHANNARIAGTKHFYVYALTQSKLVQTVYPAGIARYAEDFGGLAAGQFVQGDEIDHFSVRLV